MATMLNNCQNSGINTVIVQVRPFGDALYQSAYFPWSHLATGTQGVSPGFDPLAIIIREAHARGIRVEAWINPFRVKLSDKMPVGALAANNPANVWMQDASKAGYVVAANNGLYYNPAIAEVRDLIINGVTEIVQNYDVDGIHFDDYFYPTQDAAFDAAQFAASGAGDLAAWRRGNVNTLVSSVYSAIKAVRPSCTFGISPQGNNANNYNSQYSDVKTWMANNGYVDYVAPQLYWGFNYLTAGGRADYQFARLSAEWASYSRANGVKLYIGLGAYRVGAGDGGSNDQAEWSSGRNLAAMVGQLRATAGISGYVLYRYDNLFKSGYAQLAAQEVAALAAANS